MKWLCPFKDLCGNPHCLASSSPSSYYRFQTMILLSLEEEITMFESSPSFYENPVQIWVIQSLCPCKYPMSLNSATMSYYYSAIFFCFFSLSKIYFKDFNCFLLGGFY